MTNHRKDAMTDQARPFSTWLLEQSSGRTHDELSEALRDLVASVRDTGKKGSISLTVEVGLLDKDPNVLVVTDKVKRNFPEHDRKASIFYPDSDGNLTRSDPNQLSFDDLREVPSNNADIN